MRDIIIIIIIIIIIRSPPLNFSAVDGHPQGTTPNIKPKKPVAGDVNTTLKLFLSSDRMF